MMCTAVNALAEMTTAYALSVHSSSYRALSMLPEHAKFSCMHACMPGDSAGCMSDNWRMHAEGLDPSPGHNAFPYGLRSVLKMYWPHAARICRLMHRWEFWSSQGEHLNARHKGNLVFICTAII